MVQRQHRDTVTTMNAQPRLHRARELSDPVGKRRIGPGITTEAQGRFVRRGDGVTIYKIGEVHMPDLPSQDGDVSSLVCSMYIITFRGNRK
jgi:hypothetical protein